MRQGRRESAQNEASEVRNGAKTARIEFADVQFMISAPLLALDGH
jgi:hypothetical protein